MKPFELSMSEGCILCSFRVHVESRAGVDVDVYSLIADGIARMDGEYYAAGQREQLATRLEWAERFCMDAVNVRVIDCVPEVRQWYRPDCNVSRAYIGSRRSGYFKLVRYLCKMPDVYINLRGRSPEDERERELLLSVVQHEFAHVMGLKDQYRRNSLKKRREDIEDNDIMYRTGPSQRFMGYHIERLKRFALRGRPPFMNG